MADWDILSIHKHPDSFQSLITVDKGERHLMQIEVKDGNKKEALDDLLAGGGRDMEIEKMTSDEFHNELMDFANTLGGSVLHADQFMCPDTLVTVMCAEVTAGGKTQHITVGGLPEMSGYIPRAAFNRALKALKFNLSPSAGAE